MLVLMPSPRLITAIFSMCIIYLVYFSLTFWHPSHHYHAAGRRPAEFGRPPQFHQHARPSSKPVAPAVAAAAAAPSGRLKEAEAIIRDAERMAGAPIQSPYRAKFGTLGHRARTAGKWVQFLDDAPRLEDTHGLQLAVERAITSLFPYLLNAPKHFGTTIPFTDLRDSFDRGSRGIVIPAGKGDLRFAAHLAGSLQDVVGTTLPILIAYAGNDDLPAEDRQRLRSKMKDVSFLDISTVADDTLIKLKGGGSGGGWAIKAFAALYAPFEHVILADADAVFVQRPESMFKDPSYLKTGTLLFHDRLIGQDTQKKERRDWWRSQIQQPSATLNQSLAWTGGYADEGDSGVVVLDKSRTDVLIGLLHVAWQNTKEVRDEVTYKMSRGDKESWWFGLELSGVDYAFEKHYGAMVGWPSTDGTTEEEYEVCSPYVGHLDADDKLLWYSGGLLKNVTGASNEVGLPTHIMIDGKWSGGGGSSDNETSCMEGDKASELPKDVIGVVRKSISLAKALDRELGFV